MKNTKKVNGTAPAAPQQTPPSIVGQILITKDSNGVMKIELGADKNLVTGLSLVDYARIWLEAKCLQAILAGEQAAG